MSTARSDVLFGSKRTYDTATDSYPGVSARDSEASDIDQTKVTIKLLAMSRRIDEFILERRLGGNFR